MTRTVAFVPVVFSVVLAGLAGCASAPKTETVQQDDLSFMTTEAAAKFQASAFLTARNASSPRAVIAARRAVSEARNTQLTEAERWYLVEKVGSSIPADVLRDRGVTFVIPEERARAMAAKDPLNAYPPERRPNHVLSATVRAANRSDKTDHMALYVIEYRLDTLPGGELVWSDTVEYKRVSEGKTYD